MNKIIPFNKDITFNEKIGEIESIALDDTLKFETPYSIKGELIVRGCHKNQDVESDFSYPLPIEIAVDSKYNTEKANISIDDFYYEIINDNVLRVKIDLILDDLYYKEEEIIPESRKIDFDLDIKKEDDLLDASLDLEKDGKDAFTSNVNLEKQGNESLKASLELEKGIKEEKNNVLDLFKETDGEKEYSVYRVYVVTDNDTLDSILNKYKITKDELEKYNDLSSIKPGTKLIIPSTDE